jgi:exopolysaccharide biosynthesis polyprenyl glycosylphosphotransferase
MAAIVLLFFRSELFSSRFIVLAVWVIAFLYVAGGRIAVRLLQRALLHMGVGMRRVALIGADDGSAVLLQREFSKHPSFGYRIVKRCRAFDAGAAAELDALAKADGLDDVVVTDPDLPREELQRAMGFARSRHLAFRYTADLLATHAKNVDIAMLAGIPVITVKSTRLDAWGRIFKRIFDIVVSLLLLVVASPIMLVTALAIVVDSRGPVLFSRKDDGAPVTRVGENGKAFRYFKFRSMRPGSDSARYAELAHLDTRKDGPLVKIKDDPRVTRVGAFIRRWSIDELPEFFLVLIGKMSLVGPRPHLPEEVAKYDDAHRHVLSIKPGITGLAQVSGRSDLAFDDEVRLDTYYMENWSPWLDLAILIRTPLAVIGRRIAS